MSEAGNLTDILFGPPDQYFSPEKMLEFLRRFEDCPMVIKTMKPCREIPMSEELEGIATAIKQIQKIFGLTDAKINEIMGDQTYTAVTQNDYDHISLGDMRNLADTLGFVFVMNFQSLDVVLGEELQDE